MLGESQRARALYELAISQPILDMPEALWKGYIDFEIGQGDRERTRILYERLLDRTKHVKVWLSYAKFESEAMPSTSEEGDEEAAADGNEAAARYAHTDAATSNLMAFAIQTWSYFDCVALRSFVASCLRICAMDPPGHNPPWCLHIGHLPPLCVPCVPGCAPLIWPFCTHTAVCCVHIPVALPGNNLLR